MLAAPPSVAAAGDNELPRHLETEGFAMRGFLLVAAMIFAATPVLADEDDDTLVYFLSKAELVASGEIIEGPLAWTSEVGVVNYSFKFRATKTLKGKTDANEFKVNLSRFEFGEDRLPYLKKGGKAILFLRHGQPPRGEPDCWIGANMWFGIQPYNRLMEDSLMRLAEAKERKSFEDYLKEK